MSLNNEHIKEWLDNPKRILVGGVVVGIGGFLLYKLGKKIIDDAQHNTTESQVTDNVEVRQAMSLRSAMNPSGMSWMMSFDGTNTTVLFNTAKQIKNFDSVSSAYKKLYNDDLLIDVQKELSTEDYQKFMTLVSSTASTKSGTAKLSFAKKNQLVVAKQEVFLRSSPDASYHGAFYEFGENENIIRKAKVGEFLGYATGKQSFDVKNNVKFIESAYLVPKENLPASLKSQAGKTFTFWVSSSSDYIALFDNFNAMMTAYPSTKSDVSYRKPLDYYSGVSGFSPQAVITKKKTYVLDASLKPLISVQSGTLLGMYLMSLNTGSAQFIQFRTIDNTERWVKAESVLTK
jgi:hypothetical protein